MVQNGFKYALSGELRFLISIFTSFKTKFTRCFFPKVILVLFLFHKHSLCNPEELKCRAVRLNAYRLIALQDLTLTLL